MHVVAIDYRKSLGAMIADGNYDWVNPDITAKRFPTIATYICPQFETKLFHINRYTSAEDAVTAIKNDDPQNPWEPAKIEHLLAFGAKYPEEQRQHTIIALGSVAEVVGSRFVPFLDGYDGAKRYLALDWWGGAWIGAFRFLAVRKLSSAT